MGHRLAIRRRGCLHQAHAVVLGLQAQPARDLSWGPRPAQVRQDPAAQHLITGDLPDLRATPALLGGAVRVDQAVPTSLEPVLTRATFWPVGWRRGCDLRGCGRGGLFGVTNRGGW